MLSDPITRHSQVRLLVIIPTDLRPALHLLLLYSPFVKDPPKLTGDQCLKADRQTEADRIILILTVCVCVCVYVCFVNTTMVLYMPLFIICVSLLGKRCIMFPSIPLPLSPVCVWRKEHLECVCVSGLGGLMLAVDTVEGRYKSEPH